jgi:hypothetical protein
MRLEGDLGDRSGLTFNFNYHDEDEGTAGGLTPAQFRRNFSQNSTPNDRFEAIRLSSDLTYTRDFGRYGAIKGTLFGNFFERNWFIAGTSTISNNQVRRKFDVFGVEPQYTLNYSLTSRTRSQRGRQARQRARHPPQRDRGNHLPWAHPVPQGTSRAGPSRLGRGPWRLLQPHAAGYRVPEGAIQRQSAAIHPRRAALLERSAFASQWVLHQPRWPLRARPVPG